MGQACSREYGNFLSSGNTVHAIYSRNASLNHLFRVDSTLGIDWLTYYFHKETTLICIDQKMDQQGFTGRLKG